MELQPHSQFESIQDMDNFVNDAVEHFEMCKTDRLVLRTLATYSCKVIGVSWLKAKTLAEILEVSVRTVQRSLKRLIAFGVIKREECFRPVRGGNGASMTIICHTALSHRPVEEKQRENWIEAQLRKLDTYKLKQYLKNNMSPMDETFLENTCVPKDFAKATSYLPVVKTYDLWMKLLRHTKHLPASLQDDLCKLGIRAWKQTHLVIAKGDVDSMDKYFCGTVKGMARDLLAEYNAQNDQKFSIFRDVMEGIV
ncbi:helix-turn-helix domain-containing protein [Priestia megaterium]|uniref:helix-turn-helix domain-containing protein n=1 Tax=Priestia megaterium TaxID=1404 RepID=UPI000BFDE897|nr:helix-turn-helix domain-containing protein [Priestia megaterium]PGO60695.1 hypothetical protein CN981_09090 [Priestia megaterium]